MDDQPKERKPSFAHYTWNLVLLVGVLMGLALWWGIVPTTKSDEVALCFSRGRRLVLHRLSLCARPLKFRMDLAKPGPMLRSKS